MNIPILKIPQNVKELCRPYQPVFSKPQFKQFEKFLTGLMISEHADIEALAEGFRLSQSYDALHHFASQAPWDINQVLEQTVSVIKSLPSGQCFHEKGMLIIDDSLIEKFGKLMQAAGKLYDHSQGRFLKYAHCLVALCWTDNQKKLRYALRFELYRKKEDCQKENITFHTKIEIAIKLINWAVEQGIPFGTVVFDSWFFCKELVNHIEGLNKDWISRAKSDRLVTVSNQKISLKEYAKKKAAPEDLRTAKVRSKTYSIYSKQMKLPSLKRSNFKRAKQRVRVIISYEHKSENKGGGLKEPVFLISNRKDIRPERLVRGYQIRWNIETFFKDAKSHLGLGHYQMRSLNGIKSHWCLVFTSAVLLELVRWQACTKEGLKVSEMSFGELKQRAFGNTLRVVIEQVIAYTQVGFSSHKIYALLKI